MKLFNFEGDYIGENKGLLDFFIKTLNGMAYGLFATLLVGTILTTFATYVPLPEEVKKIILDVASVIKGLMGLGIGIGISMSLKLSGLKLIVASISGGIAVLFPHVYADPSISLTLAGFLRLSSDPLVIYVVVIGTIFVMNTILTKQTPIDIIIVPILGVIAAACFSLVVTKPIT
ncbi:MAG TPA: PTS sugar transporter subunit IIC, partial [Bacilli bacterium]|nr:PTS sugar transporter subunit IIC [Bacilli bacterium]